MGDVSYLDVEDWVWDGCTGSPDFVLGYNIRPACCIHDWERRATNHHSAFILSRNIYKCMVYGGCNRYIAMSIGPIYSFIVVPAARIRNFYRKVFK